MDADELELKGHLKNLKKEELLKRKLLKENNTRKRELEYKNISRNTSIYISGLPTDRITKEELIKQFSKYGKIRISRDGEPICKLYMNDKGFPKGDALITYSNEESVILAIEMMDESTFLARQIKVERAQFRDKENDSMDKKEENSKELCEAELPVKRPKKARSEKEEEIIDYNDDESLAKADRTVVFANLMNIYKEYTNDDIADIEGDVLEGCEEIGQVESVSILPDKGEAVVVFWKGRDAIQCCKVMSGRYFDGQKLLAFVLGDENTSETRDENDESSVEDDLI